MKENYNGQNNVYEVFRQIVQLRKIYPVHGDQISGVMSAHEFFNFVYPIKNYNNAWRILLKRYEEALREIFELFNSE